VISRLVFCALIFPVSLVIVVRSECGGGLRRLLSDMIVMMMVERRMK